jgi:hypothetical protein
MIISRRPFGYGLGAPCDCENQANVARQAHTGADIAANRFRSHAERHPAILPSDNGDREQRLRICRVEIVRNLNDAAFGLVEVDISHDVCLRVTLT